MNINKEIGFSNEGTSLTIPTVSYPKTILSYPKTQSKCNITDYFKTTFAHDFS